MNAMIRGTVPAGTSVPAPPSQILAVYHLLRRAFQTVWRTRRLLVRCIILVLAILAGCQRSHALYTIDRLHQPDWPATAAGVGPASILVETKKRLPVLICPIDPDDCTEHTLEAGSWVIHLNVPESEIWHIKIKP